MSGQPATARGVIRSVIAVALTVCAVPLEVTVGHLASEFASWIRFPGGVNAVQSAGWWMAILLVGHVALLGVTLRPVAPPISRRILTAATVIGVVSSVLWAVVLTFFLTLGAGDSGRRVSTVISTGVPILHVGLFLLTVAIASTRSRPARTVGLTCVVVIAFLAGAAVLVAPSLA